MTITIRKMHAGDAAAVATLWAAGWHDAHATIVPPGLVRLRTPESFRTRLQTLADATWIATGEAPLGLFILDGAELEQFYVAKAARGTGVAAELIAASERQLLAAGHDKVWLDCAIGNERAARFYAKHGWVNAGRQMSSVKTLEGPFDLEIWRFEKHLQDQA